MDKKPYVVADCDIPFLRGVLEPYAHVDYKKGNRITRNDLLEADVLIVRTRTRCDEALLAGTPVRLVATATIGHDHIDSEYCAQNGIRVTTAQGCNARGVLQYVMGALARLAARDGWRPCDRTLGVVGVGNVGSLIAEYGELFGFRVLRCDPPRAEAEGSENFCTLDTLLERSDIVTCHVPLTRTGSCPTDRMANAAFFASMKKGAVFINTSRGRIIEDAPLIEGLQQGRLAHAVIDTWNNEPEINLELLKLATFTTSHIAGYSIQGKAAGTAAVVRSVSRLYGWPLNDWYPAQVTPSHPDPSITWERMSCETPRYFDIEAETARLKSHPESFEQIRNSYDYRIEFF